jgi:hypothetical protein
MTGIPEIWFLRRGTSGEERVEVRLPGGMSPSPGAHSPRGPGPQGQERVET